MSLLRRVSLPLSVTFFILSVVSFGVLAAEPGTVNVSVQNEDGETISGDWYLHTGTSVSGFLLRNGSAGETFDVDAGTYFLEVRALPGDYPYYLIHSDNPQSVDEGGEITFNVEYFETEEAMLIASGNPPEPQIVGQDDTQPQEPDVYDEHGCNSTQQYVWCERSESCVQYWTPSCRVEEEEEEVAEEEEETPTVAVIDPLSYREVPDFNTPPVVSGSQEVPTFETPPATFNPEVPEEESFVLPVSLAQTGPSAVLALIPSMLIGLAVVRRKR